MSIYFEKNFQRSFGTFPLKGDALINALNAALETGYRAIDTAQMYQNEKETGATLKASGIARNELCITTKVPPGNFGSDKFLPSVEQSLRDLQVDRVDVLLVHWPPADGVIKPSLQLLEQAAKEGYAKHIGISNYTSAMMHEAATTLDTPLVTNQVEFHPLLKQETLLGASAETGIPLSSYCSVARGKVFDYPLFDELGKKYEKSPAQIVLRWILQKGVSLNTMSTKPANLQANYDIMDFSLEPADMQRVSELNNTGYRIVDKELVPWAPEWDQG